MKLTAKLAVIIGIIVTVVLSILIFISVVISKTSIGGSINAELISMSEANGSRIQEIFDSAEICIDNITSYLEREYQRTESSAERTAIPTNTDLVQALRSRVFNITLSPSNYEIETVMVENMKSSCLNNSSISGIGVFFEPYKFDERIESYSFFIDSSSANSNTINPGGNYQDYSKEDFYANVIENKAKDVTQPHNQNGVMVVSVAAPIIYRDEIYGVIRADIVIESFKNSIVIGNRYSTINGRVIDDNNRIIFDYENSDNVGKTLIDVVLNEGELEHLQSFIENGEQFETEVADKDGEKYTKFYTPIDAGGEIWWSVSSLSSKDANKVVFKTGVMLVLFSVIALIIIILIIMPVLHKLLSPIKDVAEAANSIIKGNLDINIKVKSEDEIGAVLLDFQKMSEGLKSIIYDINYILSEMSKGNFNIHSNFKEGYIGDYSLLLESIIGIKSRLSEMLTQIDTASEQVSNGSDQIAAGAQALSQGATEQASTIEQLAANISELSEQVSTNAQSASNASKRADFVGIEVHTSSQRMSEMLNAMANITDKSNQIKNIIKAIEDVAFQTNILALNAAVEAARAGEAGKGFAVVADEVRNLANKASQASKNTASLIQESIVAVNNGSKIADETAKSLEAVINGIVEVAKSIDEISRASNSQADALSQITQGIDQVSSVIQTNSATAQESAAASVELSSQAQKLKELINMFNIGGQK